MNKEIKDRLDKLENELKESKNEIHSLKSSVSLTIERGIGKLLSRFTRKQLILGSVIALFLISIIGIAGTVTKTYTFSSGDVVSASKINTNFDTLYTLVNGNLDGSNISIDNDSILFFATKPVTAQFGGRSGADQVCENSLEEDPIPKMVNSCSNVRALLSIDANDEIRDMATNYNIPTDRVLRGSNGLLFGTSWDNITSSSFLRPMIFTLLGLSSSETGHYGVWGGSATGGALGSRNCDNFGSSSTANAYKLIIVGDSLYSAGYDTCTNKRPLICICY